MNSLATSSESRRAAPAAPEVEDGFLMPLSRRASDCRLELLGAGAGEAAEADVVDRAAGQLTAGDLAALDLGPHEGDVELLEEFFWRGAGVGAPVGPGVAGTGAAKRRMCSVTSVPALPRTRSRAASGSARRASSHRSRTRSPGLAPGCSAGEPSMGAMITRWQSGPNVAQSLASFPAASTEPILGADPSERAGDVVERAR